MGKIIVFIVDDCPFCRKAKDLLTLKNVKYESISLTEKPEWRNQLFLLTNGRAKVPQIFFNEKLIGGSDALQKLEDEGKLDQLIKEALEDCDPTFPPPLRKPSGQEFLQVCLVLPLDQCKNGDRTGSGLCDAFLRLFVGVHLCVPLPISKHRYSRLVEQHGKLLLKVINYLL